jgi:hypothetical protein
MIPDQISSGAGTVAHLAVHFEELKASARSLRERAMARDRGYFTPSEDEEVRHLLVSYWQSRNALLDLVISIRDDAAAPPDKRPASFLVGFAGAVLLVDAARFLREMYEDSPVVRAKLNEADGHFGIPAGTYDAVQRSLVSVRHAWHLYHAMKYYEEHRAELQAMATDPLLAKMLETIDRLGSRLDVATEQFAKARLRVRLRQAVTAIRADLFGQALYGIQKALSRLASELSVRPGHRHEMPAAVTAELRSLLRPGDVFITRKEYAITNYFLPGYWPHAALYIGDSPALERFGIHDHPNIKPRWRRLLELDPQDPHRVLEALKDGVWLRSVLSPLASDSVVIIRPQLGESDVSAAIARGMFHEGKPYDFDFDFTRSDRMVCTEVVYRSYEGIGGIRFDLTRRAGRLTLSADDLVRMAVAGVHFDPIAVYAPVCNPVVLRGAEAVAVMREKTPAAAAPCSSATV